MPGESDGNGQTATLESLPPAPGPEKVAEAVTATIDRNAAATPEPATPPVNPAPGPAPTAGVKIPPKRTRALPEGWGKLPVDQFERHSATGELVKADDGLPILSVKGRPRLARRGEKLADGTVAEKDHAADPRIRNKTAPQVKIPGQPPPPAPAPGTPPVNPAAGSAPVEAITPAIGPELGEVVNEGVVNMVEAVGDADLLPSKRQQAALNRYAGAMTNNLRVHPFFAYLITAGFWIAGVSVKLLMRKKRDPANAKPQPAPGTLPTVNSPDNASGDDRPDAVRQKHLGTFKLPSYPTRAE